MSSRNALAQRVEQPRCGIYCRISSDDAHDELGVKRQERNCRQVVERLAGSVAGVYVDNDLSAAPGSKPRQDFERLIADLDAGLIDLIVVQNQDRISRDTVEVELFMRFLRGLGHDHYWTASAGRVGIKTTNDRLGYRVKGLFDNAYTEYVSEKVTEQQEERAWAGLPGSGGKRAFGWSCHTPRSKLKDCKIPGCGHDLGLSLIPAEAEALRTAARMVLDGTTVEATARWLTASGTRTVTGVPWTSTVLKQMLRSKRIAGLLEHKGETFTAAWPPVVDEDTWLLLDAELSERYRPQARPRTHILSGIPLCGECGKRLSAQMVTRNGHRRPRYWCRSTTKTRAAGCGRIVVTRGDLLESQVLDTVGTWLADPDLAADITAILRGPTQDETELLQAAVAAAEEELKRLARERQQLGLELFEYQEQRGPVKARLDATRARLAAARRKAAARMPLGAVTVEELVGAWPAMTDAARREVVSILAVVKVSKAQDRSGPVWNPDRVTVRPVWETG